MEERINSSPIPLGSGIKVPQRSKKGEKAPNDKPMSNGKLFCIFAGILSKILLRGILNFHLFKTKASIMTAKILSKNAKEYLNAFEDAKQYSIPPNNNDAKGRLLLV